MRFPLDAPPLWAGTDPAIWTVWRLGPWIILPLETMAVERARVRLMGRMRTTERMWASAALLVLALSAGAYAHLPRVTPIVRGIPFQDIHAGIAHWGPWAPALSVLLMVGNTFVPFPGESVGIVNGAIFGFWGGLAVSWVGVMSSAVLAFGIGRALRRCTPARGGLERLFAYADGFVSRGWKLGLVIRFVPLLPFALFNFALGRAPVGWGTFLWTTALGVLPMTAALVAVGYGAVAAPGLVLWALPALAGLIVAGYSLRRRIAVPAPVRLTRWTVARDHGLHAAGRARALAG